MTLVISLWMFLVWNKVHPIMDDFYQPYREVFYELSLNTSVCGMLQTAGKSEALEEIRLITLGVQIDIRQIQYQSELKMLQDVAPVVASFILKLLFGDPIPADVCKLFDHL